MCKMTCVSFFADIMIRSSDIELEFVKMLQQPQGTAGSSDVVSGGGQRTILTTSDGSNHIVYNIHPISPNSNIISCDSMVTPIAASTGHDQEVVRSSLESDLQEYVVMVAPPVQQPSTITSQSAEQSKFVCTKCGSSFTAQRNMKRHYYHECGIEPKHGCVYCPMRFKRRNLLKSHIIRKHTPKTE